MQLTNQLVKDPCVFSFYKEIKNKYKCQILQNLLGILNVNRSWLSWRLITEQLKMFQSTP